MGLGFSLFPISSLANAFAVWVDALENVGVGIATPDGRLHVHTDTAGVVTAIAAADDLIVEGSGNTGLSFLSGNTALQQIVFGRQSAPGDNYIRYNHSSNVFSIAANNLEFFYLVSSFRMGLGLAADGATAPDGPLHIFEGSAGVVTAAAVAHGLTVEDDTTTGISILTPAANVGGLYFGSPTANDRGRITYSHSTDQLTFATSSVARTDLTSTSFAPRTDNALSLGATGLRWTEVFAANGTINTSDERAKKNIEALDAAQAEAFVAALTPKQYEWRDVVIPELREIERVTKPKLVSVPVASTRIVDNKDGTFSKQPGFNTRLDPVFESKPVIDTAGKVIDSHRVPVMETVEREVITQEAQTRVIPGKYFGFIAQDVAAALQSAGLTPDATVVHHDTVRDTYGLREGQLVAVLWKTVQELQKKVAALEARR